MITEKVKFYHWNYYLALEQDLKKISRYIEFTKDNYEVYSIELTRLLLSSSSEVEVIMKLLCNLIDSTKKPNNINEYKEIIKINLPDFIKEIAYVKRFGLSFQPWDKWEEVERNPNWWKSYNNVKHQRNDFFKEANLQHCLNSMGGLLITMIYYYKHLFSIEANKEFTFFGTVLKLKPNSKLLSLKEDYYFGNIIAI